MKKLKIILLIISVLLILTLGCFILSEYSKYNYMRSDSFTGMSWAITHKLREYNTNINRPPSNLNDFLNFLRYQNDISYSNEQDILINELKKEKDKYQFKFYDEQSLLVMYMLRNISGNDNKIVDIDTIDFFEFIIHRDYNIMVSYNSWKDNNLPSSISAGSFKNGEFLLEDVFEEILYNELYPDLISFMKDTLLLSRFNSTYKLHFQDGIWSVDLVYEGIHNDTAHEKIRNYLFDVFSNSNWDYYIDSMYLPVIVRNGNLIPLDQK